MAIGTYLASNNKSTGSYVANGYTILFKCSFNQDAILKSFYSRFVQPGTCVLKSVVYTSGGTVVSDFSSNQSVAVADTTTFYEITYPSTMLTSGVVYYIGYYVASEATSGNQPTVVSSSTETLPSSPAFASLTISGATWVAGSVFSSDNYAYGPAGGFSFDSTNVLPTAPTGLSTNSPVAVGNPIATKWTHNDPDSDPQAKYQIRYRKL